MTVFQEGRHAAEFLMYESGITFSRDNITIAGGNGVIPAGTVLGKLTDGGKYVPATATGATGAQTGVALNLYPVDTTGGDVPASAITRNAEVNGKIINYHSSVDNDTKKAAKANDLRAVGIIVR